MSLIWLCSWLSRNSQEYIKISIHSCQKGDNCFPQLVNFPNFSPQSCFCCVHRVHYLAGNWTRASYFHHIICSGYEMLDFRSNQVFWLNFSEPIFCFFFLTATFYLYNTFIKELAFFSLLEIFLETFFVNTCNSFSRFFLTILQRCRF